MVYHFANVLLAGPCNRACPDCIGRQTPSHGSLNTLHTHPLPGMQRFASMARILGITEVSLTGINTEPQLYQFQRELLAALRLAIPGARVSLHTNGSLALHQMDLFNLYDRATVSFPSFREDTTLAMTGVGQPIDLASILSRSRIPIKLSVLLTAHNTPQVPHMLERFSSMGVQRVVLRRRSGDTGRWPVFDGIVPSRWFGGNPVFDLPSGLEVTLWDFSGTRLRCLQLFPDGSLSCDYEIRKVQSG